MKQEDTKEGIEEKERIESEKEKEKRVKQIKK